MRMWAHHQCMQKQTGIMITYLHLGPKTFPSSWGSFGSKVLPGFAYHLPSAPTQASSVKTKVPWLEGNARHIFWGRQDSLAFKRNKDHFCLYEKRSEIPQEGKKLLPLPINKSKRHWKVVQSQINVRDSRDGFCTRNLERAQKGRQGKNSNNYKIWKQIQLLFHANSRFCF